MSLSWCVNYFLIAILHFHAFLSWFDDADVFFISKRMSRIKYLRVLLVIILIDYIRNLRLLHRHC
jgi:hypothetical protein